MILRGKIKVPKKLYKIEQGRVFCGVCGGIAEYFNLDHNIVRLIAVLISVFTACFPMFIAYIVMACVLPLKSQTF